MRRERTRLLSKRLSLIFAFLFLLSIVLLPGVMGIHQNVRGYVRFSDGSNIPNGIDVTITDVNNSNSMTRYTQQANGGPGFYLLDVEDLGASNGHIINVSVTYGGCIGSSNIAVDKTQGPSVWCNVTIVGNLPPDIPSQPSGNVSGYHGFSYSYSTVTNDSDMDNLYYWFDWGDGSNSGWVGPYSSGAAGSASHSWDALGNYTVKVKSKDEHDAERGIGWSNTLSVTMVNLAPNGSSRPSGVATGYNTISYSYSASATDINGDDVYYWFDWGDGGNSGWVGPYSSGSTGSAFHAWSSIGAYQVKAKVKDEYDLETDAGWSDPFNVTITALPPGGNSAPIADFSYSPSSPLVNENIDFTDASYDYDGSIVSWSWDFGDGTESSEQNPSHAYSEAGEYSVNLTVTDDRNSFSTKQRKISVYLSSPDSDNITWDETAEVALKYNSKNKGINYLVWKGEAVNASSFADKSSLSNGDSISVFSKADGEWLTYTVGSSSRYDDFLISLWDIVIIKSTGAKNILVDISKQNDIDQSVTINFILENESGKGNKGYNFFVWTSTQELSVEEFVVSYGLSDENIEISIYDADNDRWRVYNPSVPSEFQDNFDINKYDIICVKMVKGSVEKVLTIQ